MDNVGVRGFHARDSQKGPMRAIVEGDLFLWARSSGSVRLAALLPPPSRLTEAMSYSPRRRRATLSHEHGLWPPWGFS